MTGQPVPGPSTGLLEVITLQWHGQQLRRLQRRRDSETLTITGTVLARSKTYNLTLTPDRSSRRTRRHLRRDREPRCLPATS